MDVKVLRGERQIGGNIIEVSTATTRILLDVGLELNEENQKLPDIDGLFDNASYDAVFISHYHGDHLGLAYYIDKSIPLYIGEDSYKIVRTTDEYKRKETIKPAGFLKHCGKIVIGDITITSFLCDHSAFDSYMILCEANGKNVLYTGDFRSNGRKSFMRLLECLPKKVDKLICEGTNLSRDFRKILRELEIESNAVDLFKKNTGPIFVLQSSTNIDRIVTMYRAAKRTGRVFLEEVYMAEVANAVGGNIPNPKFKDVYTFITNSKRYDLLSKYKNRIGKQQISKLQFVMCVRSSMLKYLQSLSQLMSFENGLLVYSMWKGYKEKEQMKEFIDGCNSLNLRIVDLHTSGHADAFTIRQLIDNVNPNEIIPIHTTMPEWFTDKIVK